MTHRISIAGLPLRAANDNLVPSLDKVGHMQPSRQK